MLYNCLQIKFGKILYCRDLLVYKPFIALSPTKDVTVKYIKSNDKQSDKVLVHIAACIVNKEIDKQSAQRNNPKSF